MTKSEEVAELIAQLERVIGKFYHNDQERGGFFFRYPVRLTRDGTEYECKGDGIIPDLTFDELSSIHYKTGANSLYIGRALFEVLQFLENRYDGEIDFTQLEKERKFYLGIE